MQVEPTLAAPIPNADEKPSPADSKPRVSPTHFTWRRIAVFGSIVSAIILCANALVCATWSYFFNLPGWTTWQVLPGVLAIAFIPATSLRFRSEHFALTLVYGLSASWLGALNFAFFAAVACWLVAGAAWLAGWPLPHFQLAAALFGLAFLATAYGLFNAKRVRVNRITVRLPHLPEAWRGRTAALVTDLHLGPLAGAGFLRRVIARLRSLQPKAVFISGDMFDGSTLGRDRLVAPWRDFSAPLGIYFVTGNHDEFADRNLFLDAVNNVGIHVLNNEMVAIDGLQLVGVHDAESEAADTLRSILSRAQINRQRPSILLAHRPVNLSIAEAAGISLQLSGHTHRGQLWPWNLMVSRIYGNFAYGLSRLGRMQVYTSSGVGTWGPPLRLGTQSEIVLIRFEAASALVSCS